MEKFLGQIEYFYKKNRGNCTLCIKTVSSYAQGGFNKDNLDPYCDEILERAKKL